MPLPELIEIVPLEKPVHAEITVPGSKSITNRALILAALAKAETTLKGALWSEDTQVMVDCLRKLDFKVNVTPDLNEFSNRTITVQGIGGKIPKAGTEDKPLELFVGNAGTAARFLSALVCLGNGVYRLTGVARMHERPQAALFKALRELGYHIESANDKLPAIIHGAGPQKGECTVTIEESSQFASALLLGGTIGDWKVKVVGENAEESPYVAMTIKLIEAFPTKGGTFQIEPDASSGSYFFAATGFEAEGKHSADHLTQELNFVATVRVKNWPTSTWQIDSAFLSKFVQLCFLAQQNAMREEKASKKKASVVSIIKKMFSRQLDKSAEVPSLSRQTDLGDSIMTAIALAPTLTHVVRFSDLGRLRVQESERVVALRTQLTNCGAAVEEEGDTLTIYPSQLHGAEIETYNDHRMAMCFAILGLKVPGIRIKNPACVKKTFPDFFQKLAAAPPAGLGAIIRDVKTGQRLEGAELFAE